VATNDVPVHSSFEGSRVMNGSTSNVYRKWDRSLGILWWLVTTVCTQLLYSIASLRNQSVAPFRSYRHNRNGGYR